MAVVASATGAAVFGLSGVAAGIAGGALLGAGAGALYSGLTGDGNILNSALTGGLLGAGVGGLGAAAAGTTAAGGTSALTAASAPSTALAPTANVLTQVPAVSLSSANPAALDALAASQKVFAEGAASLPGAGLTVAPQTITPELMAATGAQPSLVPGASTALTGKEMLGYGLAGTAAMSLIGSQNQPKIQTPSSTSYIRPYTYAQTRNPNFGQPGQPYYVQKMIAQPVYQAAQGGLMAAGGAVEEMSRQNTGKNMYPMSMVDSAKYSTPLQIPVNTSVITTDYEPKTNLFTGELSGMAAGGTADSGYIPTSQAVQDYNKMLSNRATEEYLRNPMPSAMMPASQRQAPPPTAPTTPQAPAITQDINGLYQYYLGRQPGKDEASQYSSQINGPVTPEMAAYFQQFTGDELAKTGYKPTGPNPFLGQAPIPMSGPMGSLAGQAGLPQYTYNAATRSYVPVAQAYTPFVQPAPPPMANNMDMGGGGKAGGLMPYNLGGYSDGGRLLKGPGDGMSDNIPASIGQKQPARLADGEFVIPADVVSHLGNGSTDAGAKKLYAMMDKVRTARTGNKKQGKQIKAEKYLKT